MLEILWINSLVTVRFCCLKALGKEEDENMMRSLPAESNQIVKKFDSRKPGLVENAFNLQTLLHMKKEFCEKNQCLPCNLGLKIRHRREGN